MEQSDSAVIAASVACPDAFGALFDRHGGMLLRFLMRRVAPAEAEGLLGEVFRIAFERREVFDRDRDSARPWLYGIASNVVAKHHRSEARRLRATARLVARPEPGGDPTEPAVSALDARATWPRVAEAVAALPERERAVLLLFAWEELSYDQIAEVLEVPVGTVRSRLHRARARLRAMTEESETVGRTNHSEPGP
jgi:RNA polymerase sigma factor (sigma-70 family)